MFGESSGRSVVRHFAKSLVALIEALVVYPTRDHLADAQSASDILRQTLRILENDKTLETAFSYQKSGLG